MVFLFVICLLFGKSFQIGESITEILVEKPFYLRARILDSHTVNVQFEIAKKISYRLCQKYKFTIHRNRENPYSMPEQNLTYWRNSLELKHLAVGNYTVCAIICSEHLKQNNEIINKTNRSLPISGCIHFYVHRSHFLILTLYILVIILLIFSQITFTLRKRKFKARIKTALIEVENVLQKWRSSPTSSVSSDQTHSFNILQSLLTLPVSPIEHTTGTSFQLNIEDDQLSHPIIFHLETFNEQLTREIS